MKSQWIKYLLILVFITAFSACVHAPLESEKPEYLATYPSQLIIGDTYILKSNEKIVGNIVGIGTSLIIEENASITGDISLIGSDLDIAGQIDGDLNVLAGTSTIKDTAAIRGDINQLFQTTDIAPNARITGEINTFSFPDAAGGGMGNNLASYMEWLRPATVIGFQTARVIGLILLSLIGITLFKNQTIKVATAIQSNSPAAWGAGLLALIASPILASILIITICLCPVGILFILAVIISNLWGWAALSYIAGSKITLWLKLDWRIEPVTILALSFWVSFQF